MTRVDSQGEDPTLHLPRILCLHGGGTNVRIFRFQCRVLEAQLKSKFRLCYAEAPFPSQAGPDVLSVFKDFGPFKRWLHWLPEHPEIDAETAVRSIKESLNAAMREDDRKGATGEWVGLLGFSQGAKVCASLLFRQQVRAEKLPAHQVGSNYRFAVLLAARAPLVALDPELADTPALANPDSLDKQSLERKQDVLRLPTIHVHGMRDPGLDQHKQLLQYCEKGSTRLIIWDGEHRVPIKGTDVANIVREMVAIAKETHALRE